MVGHGSSLVDLDPSPKSALSCRARSIADFGLRRRCQYALIRRQSVGSAFPQFVAFAMAAGLNIFLFKRFWNVSKPKPELFPNTYAYESEPMVKATGFREYDARWLFGKEINLMGIQALGMGLGALIGELGAEAGNRHRTRFPWLFGLDQIRADLRPDGVRLQGARHRPRGDADGLFRAVRTRRAVCRDGDGLA